MPKLELRVPGWQVVALLVVFPLLYAVNARLPWSQGLWVGHDKAYFVPFWSSILVLHTLGSVAVISILRKKGTPLAAIGFDLDRRQALVALGSLVAVGLLAVAFREWVPYANTDDLGWQIGWPVDQRERFFWIVVCLFAGVCEELIFRGFAIPTLESRDFHLWQVVLLSNISFSLIHGAADLTITAISFGAGLVFTALYLWRRNLALVMIVHALSDLTFLVTP